MTLWHQPLDAISYADIEASCMQKRPERLRLDYKVERAKTLAGHLSLGQKGWLGRLQRLESMITRQRQAAIGLIEVADALSAPRFRADVAQFLRQLALDPGTEIIGPDISAGVFGAVSTLFSSRMGVQPVRSERLPTSGQRES